MESVATRGGTRTLRGQHNRVKLKLITILSVLVCQETQLQAASILDCWWTHHHYEAGTKGRCKELTSFLRPKHQVMARHRCTGPNLPHPVSAIGLKITLFPVNTVLAIQNKHNLPNNGGNGKKTFRSRTDQDQGGRQGPERDIESVALHDIVLYLISCSPPRPSQANPILVHL